jgi:hypothetical protein
MRRQSWERYYLPDDGLLVRGGLMLPEDLWTAAETARVTMRRPGISAFGGESVTLEDVLAQHPIRHAQFRRTTAGRVREAGFELEQTGRAGHYTIWVPDTDHETLIRLADSFDPPERNPHAGRVPRSTG